MFDYLVAHGRMKEKEARVKFRQVHTYNSVVIASLVASFLYISNALACKVSLF